VPLKIRILLQRDVIHKNIALFILEYAAPIFFATASPCSFFVWNAEFLEALSYD
jgi:hypothetical protein